MRLNHHPTVRHSQIPHAVDAQDTAELSQVMALRILVTNVLDNMIADDHIKGMVSKRQGCTLYPLISIAIGYHTIVDHIDGIDLTLQ